MMSGDEFYDDEVTSGPIEDEAPVARYGRGATSRCRSFPPGQRVRGRQCTLAPKHTGDQHHNVHGDQW